MRPVGLAVLAALVVAGCSGSAGTAPGARGPAAPAVSARASVARAPETTAPANPAVPAPAKRAAARTPCTANERPQLVFVSLRRQHLWMCARHRVVRDSPITSGMVGQYTETPTGTYEIQGLNRNSYLTLNTGQSFAVKYWIPFDAPLFGFHDSSWQKFPYGSDRYRTDGSHGCVHVPLAAIRFLYQWARIGATVRIKA